MEQIKVKKPIYKRGWFIATVVIIVLYSIGNHQIETTKNNTPSGTTKSEETKPVEAIKVTAVKLSEDYKANEVSADEKYKHKIVEVSGLVDTIGKDILNTPYIALQTYQYAIIDKIQCMFSKSDSDVAVLSKVSKDQKVTLRGEVSGKSGNVLITGCELIK